MNRKLILLSIVIVLMLVMITYATAIKTVSNDFKKKESPLFGIRAKLANEERLENIKIKIKEISKNIKSRFLGERIFFLPFNWLNNIFDASPNKDTVDDHWACSSKRWTGGCYTCYTNCNKKTYHCDKTCVYTGGPYACHDCSEKPDDFSLPRTVDTFHNCCPK